MLKHLFISVTDSGFLQNKDYNGNYKIDNSSPGCWSIKFYKVFKWCEKTLYSNTITNICYCAVLF